MAKSLNSISTLKPMIDEINNDWIDAKYRQMGLQSARWRCSRVVFLGTPGQTKVMQM